MRDWHVPPLVILFSCHRAVRSHWRRPALPAVARAREGLGGEGWGPHPPPPITIVLSAGFEPAVSSAIAWGARQLCWRRTMAGRFGKLLRVSMTIACPSAIELGRQYFPVDLTQ